MLKKLFRPKWQNSNPDTRSDAAKQLDPEVGEEREILLKLVKEDPNESVKQSAIERIRDLATLNELLGQNNQLIETLVRTRYVDLVSGRSPGLDIAQQRTAIDECTQEQLADIAQMTNIPELQEMAITHLTDQQCLQQIVCNSTSAKIRQLAVVGIIDADTLKVVIATLKNKDKRALQIARDKLNALKESAREAAALEQAQEQLCAQMEALAKAAYSSQYLAKHLHLNQQWKDVEETLGKALLERLQNADARCQAVIKAHESQERERLESAQEQEKNQQQQQQLRLEVEGKLTDIHAAIPLDETALQSLEVFLADTSSRWQTFASISRAGRDEQSRFDKASRTLSEFLTAAKTLSKQIPSIEKLLSTVSGHETNTQFNQSQKWLQQVRNTRKRIKWPTDIPAPQALKSLQELDTQLQQHIADLQAQSKQIKDTIAKQLLELEQKLDEGAIDEAKSLSSRVRNDLDKLERKDGQAIEHQLRTLQNRLNEFFDWQHFATDPKRESLCAEMEKLITTDIPAPQKAQAIKALQEEWKNLGDSHNSQKLWQRFRKAADTAYIPCKEHFSNQGNLRAHNLQQRQKINQSLKEYIEQTNWDSVDWKVVENIFNVARQDWRQFTPVDRSKTKAAQKEFDQLLDTLNEKIKTERKQNAERKTGLIAQASELLTQDDVGDAIEKAKLLQQQWKSIGITFRKENQQLWKQFREVCDQIFERRHQAREAEQQEMDDNLKQAKALCDQIRQLADAEDDLLSQSQPQLNTLKESYSQLGPLPRDKSQSVNQQYRGACEHYKQRFSGIRGRSELRVVSALEACAQLCDQLDALDESAQEQRASLQAQWEKPPELSADWWQSIDERFQRSLANVSDEILKTNEATLRTLCIRLEILAGLETPEQDQAERMEFQMARLSKGLGQDNTQDMASQLGELQLQWLFTGPHPGATFEALQTRFQASVAELRKQL